MTTLRDLISTHELSIAGLNKLIDDAIVGKKSFWKDYSTALKNRVIGLLFFNPSLRTRASLQSGIARLGGEAVVLNAGQDAWKIEIRENAIMNEEAAEHVIEASGVLSSYFDAVGIRSFPQMNSWAEDSKDSVIMAFRRYLTKPLINLESCLWHPCQSLADAVTIRERFGRNLSGRKFVLSWANHPKQLPMAVPNSTLVMAAQMGLDITVACPEGYELSSGVVEIAQKIGKETGSKIKFAHSQSESFSGADIVYAKSWTPPKFVGKKEEEMLFRKEAGRWTIDQRLMNLTNSAIFMHCLPVRRNVKVTDEVLDSKDSVVIEQAENRLHAQNALLLSMFGEK